MSKNLRSSIKDALNSSIKPGLLAPEQFHGSTLDLDFAGAKSLKNQIGKKDLVTFARASSGTFVGADGLIKTTPVNLMPRSEQLDQWFIFFGASVTANAIAAPDGTLTADFVDLTDQSSSQVTKAFSNAKNSTTYTVSFYGRVLTGTDTVKLYRSSLVGGSVDFTFTSEWQRFTSTYSTTADSSYNNVVFLNRAGSTNQFYIWGVQVEEGSIATDYIPTKSTICGAPRFDHDPATGKSLGLLIEESSTNRNNKSKSFSTWAVSSGFSLVYDSATAPDGTTSATALDRNGSGLARLEKNFSVGSGGATTFSVFAKSVNTTTGRYLRLAVNDAQTGERFADFDLVDGTVDVAATNGGNFTNAASRIEEYPNDWYRCSLTFSKTSGGSENSICFHKLYIRQSDNSTNTPSGVTDVGMHVWGGQVEEKTFPTSLIETDGSTVTRAADVAQVTGTNFSSFYNQSEGTMFVDAGTSANTGNFDLFEYSNGTTSVRHTVRYDSNTSRVGFTGNTVSQQYVSLSSPANIKAAATQSLGFAVNGVLTGNSGTSNSGTKTQLAIGYRGSSSAEFINGHIKRLSYFPMLLSDATLQSITS